MLPRRLVRHAILLKYLSCKSCNKKQIIKSANSDFIKCLSDCAINIVKKKSKNCIKLFKYKNVLNRLASRKIPINYKKKIILNQRGGFLPLLIGPALAILGELALKSL